MKLTYKAQLWICVALIILGNILSDVFTVWIYRSAAFLICGLIWILHPIVPDGMERNRKNLFWTCVAGVVLLLIGLFTRVHSA